MNNPDLLAFYEEVKEAKQRYHKFMLEFRKLNEEFRDRCFRASWEETGFRPKTMGLIERDCELAPGGKCTWSIDSKAPQDQCIHCGKNIYT